MGLTQLATPSAEQQVDEPRVPIGLAVLLMVGAIVSALVVVGAVVWVSQAGTAPPLFTSIRTYDAVVHANDNSAQDDWTRQLGDCRAGTGSGGAR